MGGGKGRRMCRADSNFLIKDLRQEQGDMGSAWTGKVEGHHAPRELNVKYR